MKSGSIIIKYQLEPTDDATELSADDMAQLHQMLSTTPDWMQSCVDESIAAAGQWEATQREASSLLLQDVPAAGIRGWD
eukprot:COSAG06_NODE_20327_length_799_cov_11.891429_1_plen_78_part_10